MRSFSVEGLLLDEISLDQFFMKVNQLDAWRYILGIQIQMMEYFTNPLRVDKSAGCWLRYYENKILIVDFNTSFNGNDCVTFFAKATGLRHMEAARILFSVVNQGYQYNYTPNTQSKAVKTGIKRTESNSEIQWVIRQKNNSPIYTQQDFEYFHPRGITTRQLIEDQVFSISSYQVGNKLIIPKCACYVMKLDTRVKIYHTCLPKRERFIGTVQKDDVWEWKSENGSFLSEHCIISKAWKDGREIFNCLGDIDVYAFQNEGVLPTRLDFINKNYDRKIIFYDNDETGVKAAIKLCGLLDNAEALFVPKEIGKDFDDYVMYNLIKANQWLIAEFQKLVV